MVALSGCVERLADFSVQSLEGVRCTGIDGKGFNLLVRCQLQNPNGLGATVQNVHFQTFAGRYLLGEGRFQGPLRVRPKSEFLLEVPVRVSYSGLPADFPERVKDGHLRMRTEVNLTAKTKLGSYDMHLSTVDRVKIAEALGVAIQGPFRGGAFRIDSITLAGLKLRRVTLRIRFTARNMFAFPFRIRRGTFGISINGSPFGDTKLEQPLQLEPRSQVSVDTVVTASHGAVGRAIAAMMGEDPRFRLKGTLWIDPIGGVDRLPVEVDADSSIFGQQ
jgi:LEA14-like dessication related protein